MHMTRRISIETLQQSPDWPSFDKDEICEATLRAADFKKDAEVTVTFTNDAEIQILNKQHRGKDKPTNVLSFPAYDPDEPHPPGVPVNLGDIVLAYETIEREATEQNKTFNDHVMHLIVHGVLHLLGYDHEDDDEAEEMESLEIAVLRQFGIKNPYEEI